MNLFIDTHLNDVAIILYDNLIIAKEIIKEKKENSRIIMPTIKKVIGDNKLSSIIVVNGPGSFTGVRLGVTIAKTLAYTLNIPIRTVTSLECLAICSPNHLVAFSDNNGYYVGNFNKNMSLKEEYKYLSNSEFVLFSSKNEVSIDSELYYDKIIKYALEKKPINPHQVNPIYIKKLSVEK